MKIFKKDNFVQIHFSDGKVYTNKDCDSTLWEFVGKYLNDEEELKAHLMPEAESKEELMKSVEESDILILRGCSVYMKGVSEITIPEDFVKKILKAEKQDDKKTLQKYINFWRLVSMNPDARVRNNIFWFIRKWDMQISDSGFIIGYRNADIKNENQYTTNETKNIINRYYEEKYIKGNNPNDIPYKHTTLASAYTDIIESSKGPTYTDHHSHTMKIVLGQPVKMPREECDAEQENSCSSGLHVGSKGWLKENYFGSVGMQVLVNPMNIVAVPSIDEYGKMRCCEYFPVCLIDFDNFGDVIEPEYSLFSDVAYLNNLKIEGEINNTDVNHYTIETGYRTREEIYEDILGTLK